MLRSSGIVDLDGSVLSVLPYKQDLPNKQDNVEVKQLGEYLLVSTTFFLFVFISYFTLCSFRCYHLFSHEAQGQNIPNSLTVGMGFHCSYVPSITLAMGGSYSDFNQYHPMD